VLLHRKKIPDESLKCAVQLFYESDEVSRVSPRARDVKNYTDNDGLKTLKARRFLFCTVSESYELFKIQHPQLKISGSFFAKLRPAHVEVCSKTPLEMCVCDTHDNIRFIFNALWNFDQSLFHDFKYQEGMWTKFVCQLCSNCKNASIIRAIIKEKTANLNLNDAVSWFDWIKVTKRNRTADDNEHIQIKKHEKKGTLSSLLAQIYHLIPGYLWHSYVQRTQSDAYKSSISLASSPESNKAVVHVDFAENFHCFEQDQPQAAHFSQAQITLFTVALWHRSQCETIAYVTNITKHNKFVVSPFLMDLLSKLPQTVEEVNFISDNARSQFKCRYILNSLKKWALEYQKVKVAWTFLAEKHGKGIVDAIGATVKSKVANLIKNRRVTVKNAREFADACAGIKTEIRLIESSQIDAKRESLTDFFESDSCKPIKNVSKFFYFVAENDTLKCSLVHNRL
jgi:hypothetical protein